MPWIVTGIGYRLVLARSGPALAVAFQLPTAKRIDGALLGGAALFGIGWGMTGFCPGGLIPMLGTGRLAPLVFLAGLVAGLTAARQTRAWTLHRSTTPQAASN